jgi:uncharacterized protein YecE (DUF72 family)
VHQIKTVVWPEIYFDGRVQNKIHIGTSGWSYKHWRGLFYPDKLAASKWLNYYRGLFSTTEINGSFYRLPTEETVIKWTDGVSEDFLFCPKISRYLTHMKKLRDPEEPLERFFSVFEFMKKKMGPVLIQLPPMLKFSYDVAEHFYRLLKMKYREYNFVIEVRHDTWLQEQSLTLMTAYDIGFVISQSDAIFPYAEVVTAKNIYIRFHGPAELYASSYSDDALKNYAGKFKEWVKEGHEVWAYFNNDIHGYATKDALRLLQWLEKI